VLVTSAGAGCVAKAAVRRSIHGWRAAACASLLGALLLGGGCTSYHVVEPGEVRQGAPVRAILAQPVDVNLDGLTVRGVQRVDGEMVRVADDELLLSAFWVLGSGAAEFPARGETVALPAAALDRLDHKRISWWKTAGTVAGLALTGFLVEQVLTGAFGSGSGGGSGHPQPR
jgi:hypothetical protein